jgi:hypothetical protein
MTSLVTATCSFPHIRTQDKGCPVRTLSYLSMLHILITKPNYPSNSPLYNKITPQFQCSLNKKPGAAAKRKLMLPCGGIMHQSKKMSKEPTIQRTPFYPITKMKHKLQRICMEIIFHYIFYHGEYY